MRIGLECALQQLRAPGRIKPQLASLGYFVGLFARSDHPTRDNGRLGQVSRHRPGHADEEAAISACSVSA